VDLVAVCVRVPDHREIVMSAVGAGKHVYCEWPLGVNAREAEEIAAAARAAGVVAMVGLQAQASPVIERVRRLVEAGYAGRVLAASLTGTTAALGGPELPPWLSWAADVDNGASVLTIPTSHGIDALFTCVGEPLDVVASVRTQTPRVRDAGTGEELDVTAPDQVVACGALANGGAYSVHVQGGAVGDGFRLAIHGTDGVLVASTPVQGLQLDELTLQGAQRGERIAVLDVPGSNGRRPPGPAGNVCTMYMRLAAAIEAGRPAFPDFEHAVRRHRLLEALVDASDNGIRREFTP
jgi:predicted dehydrogenase